jgi:hypothetical protein
LWLKQETGTEIHGEFIAQEISDVMADLMKKEKYNLVSHNCHVA